MKKNVEAAIDILRDEQGGRTRMVTVTKDFEEKFRKIIVEHFLRKFHWFYLQSTTNPLTPTIYSPFWGSTSSFRVGREDFKLAAKVDAKILY